MKTFDEVVDTDKLTFPQKEEITNREKEVEKYLSLILGIIKSSIKSTETIVVSQNYFPNKDVFGSVMCRVGEYFANTEDIEVHYQKPEDKNPSSPTYGEVIAKFVVNNIALITSNKIMKDEHKMAMNSISKDVRNNIIETVKKKYEKKEENE